MRLTLLSAATTAVLAMGAPAMATVVLTFSDGTFVGDTDGQLQPVTNLPVVDIETFDNTTIPLDVRLFSLNTLGVFDFSILRDDFSEIAGLSPISTAANVTLLGFSNDALFYEYDNTGTDTVGDILASFEVLTADVDLRPDDELPDIILSDTDNDLGIWDPAKSTEVIDLDVDVQTIPLPAGMFLLAGALGGLSLMRRRNAA